LPAIKRISFSRDGSRIYDLLDSLWLLTLDMSSRSWIKAGEGGSRNRPEQS
jgi:hypothetical protein